MNIITITFVVIPRILILTTRSDHTGAFAHDHSSVFQAKSPSGQWITTLSAWADRICGCDGLFDLGVTNSAPVYFLLTTVPRVLWLYLYSTDIGAVPDAKFSLFRLTVRRQVVAVFVLPFRPKPAPI